MSAIAVVSKKLANGWCDITEKRWMALLCAIVFLANMQIYSIHSLIQDDNGLYYLWNSGQMSVQARFHFSYLNAGLTWIASRVDFYLARSIVLVGILIPVVLLLFRILRKLDYPLPVALFSACLVGFSPGQLDIPIFVNGSYTAGALLVLLIAFWSGLRFIDEEGTHWAWYLASIFMAWWALHMSELVVPASLSLTICFLFWRRFGKGAWVLSVSYAVVAISFTYFDILHHGRSVVGQAKPVTFGGFVRVVEAFLLWCVPSIYIPGVAVVPRAIFMTAACGLCIIVGVALAFSSEKGLSNAENRHPHGRSYYIWRIAFPVMFSLSALVVMTVAPWFRPRHALFPAVGLYVLISFSLYIIFHKYRYGKIVISIILLLFAAGSIIQHWKNIRHSYYSMNTIRNDVLGLANIVNFPHDAQIVAVNINPQTYGFWRWSTGYLESVLNRNDISGLLGDEVMYIDPFARASFRPGGMNGLDRNRPLFLYRKTSNGFKQLTYFLRWKTNSKDSPFTLFQADPVSGSIRTITTGRGWEDYQRVIYNLSKVGIKRSDVMWGGKPSPRDMRRLGLSVMASNG